MKISNLETFIVNIAYTHEEVSSRIVRGGVTAVIVKLSADNGLVGWGEGCGDWPLGGRPPKEAYLAPIESGGRVVALLYADQLPRETPIPDTTLIEVAIGEAGMALDRVLLERALAEASS